jgi:hypothetical protein
MEESKVERKLPMMKQEKPAHVRHAVVKGDLETLRHYQELSTESKARKKAAKALEKETMKAPNTVRMKDAPKPDPVRFQEELDKRYP